MLCNKFALPQGSRYVGCCGQVIISHCLYICRFITHTVADLVLQLQRRNVPDSKTLSKEINHSSGQPSSAQDHKGASDWISYFSCNIMCSAKLANNHTHLYFLCRLNNDSIPSKILTKLQPAGLRLELLKPAVHAAASRGCLQK